MCAFGLAEGHTHQRIAQARLAEANLRIDIWHLLQCGALVEGTATELEWGDGGGPRPGRTVNVRRLEGPNVTIDGTRVPLAWDAPMEGVERPWFVCPAGCGRRVRHLYLRDDRVACRRCHRLDHAVRHVNRQVPALARLVRLRRKLGGCELRPFAPLPERRRGRSRAYHDKLVAMIHAEEVRLLEHLGGVVHDLKRRIRVRKARHRW